VTWANFDHDLQQYLTKCTIHWTALDNAAHGSAEAEWRSIYGQPRAGQNRWRTGAKAAYEFSLEPCARFLIVPFTANVRGFPISVYRRSMQAYECHGTLVPLGDFNDAEFFVCPLDFAWTMVYTHEDYAFGGPWFIRREWIVSVAGSLKEEPWNESRAQSSQRSLLADHSCKPRP
jgi:hypothetical protein